MLSLNVYIFNLQYSISNLPKHNAKTFLAAGRVGGATPTPLSLRHALIHYPCAVAHVAGPVGGDGRGDADAGG